jgi:hypothetical protein
VCPTCGCIFSKAFYAKDEMHVECPNCHNSETIDHYKEIEYETNPIKSIGGFKNLLQDANRDELKQYFLQTVKKYSLHFRNGGFFFTNLQGEEVSVSEVHEFIISDRKYWVDLYNMYMTLYR